MSDNEEATAEPTVEAVALVDIDGDGIVDAVVTLEENGDTVTYVDVDGDGTIDAIISTTEDGQDGRGDRRGRRRQP